MRPDEGGWSSHAEMRCGGSVGGSTRSASHWSYDHGHSPVFDFWKTARPRLPKVHSAGQYPPPCGSFARNSTMPPVKQNLFHDCSIAERNGMWMPFSPVGESPVCEAFSVSRRSAVVSVSFGSVCTVAWPGR